MVSVKELNLAVGLKGRPVAADDAVMGDNRLEDAAVIVGAVGMLGWQDDVAALVADEVFVVGRNQEVFALAESARAAIIGEIKLTASPFHGVNPVTQ